MQNLSDFKPLQRVVLPDLGSLDCSGLILIVGPNSSGKTQLLQDLYQTVSGEPRTLVVAEAIELRKPEGLEPFLTCLEREGYLTRVFDENGVEYFRPLTTFVGSGQGGGQIQLTQPQQWWQAYATGDVGTSRRHIEFLGYFGRLLISALFIERRLISVNQTSMFDFERQSPQHDLHALYVNDSAKAALYDEIQASFGRAIWPDASRGTVLCLRVSDDGTLPPPETRLSPKAMSQYRTIETEGDGLKSYVATCIALLLGSRPICLVDEPELCLHPPQAYNLGRFIGRFGASRDRATFIATHSSHVLRGVIQATETLQIVRLTRRGAAFQAHLVSSRVLTQILTRPTVRAETVLDGIFAQAVIVLEADGDRAVYQTVFETLRDELRIDVHFTAVGGTGGIADTCRLYRTLQIPIAVIVDLDVLTDQDRFRQVVSVLAASAEAERLTRAASAVASAIKSLPPVVTPEDVRRRLGEVLASEMDWSKNTDASLRITLQELARDLDRMRRLKREGIRELPTPIASDAQKLLEECAGIGFFIVPVGELEEWLKDQGVSASKRNKWAWANEAAAKVRKLGPRQGDIWDFIRSVGRHLNQTIEQLSGS